MSNAALPKMAARTAKEVCQRFPLSDKGRPLLKEGLTPGQFLGVLVESGCLTEAVQLLAHALPKREAIGWAVMCARQVYGPKPEPLPAAALDAAQKWVLDPTEANRRTAQKAAEAAGYSTAAGCCASAVFWSGGSLAGPDQPVVAPDESLTAKGVSGAVLLAGLIGEPAEAMARYRKFVDLGLEVAKGATPWKK